MRSRIHVRLSGAPRFRTGVSLHSHTLHSRESLNFIYHAARHSALLRWVLRRGERRYRVAPYLHAAQPAGSTDTSE